MQYLVLAYPPTTTRVVSRTGNHARSKTAGISGRRPVESRPCRASR